jgi:hypothetical protein
MIDNLKAANVDDRRRVVLPDSCPPNCPVIIHEFDQDTWIVTRAKRNKKVQIVCLKESDETEPSKNPAG